MGRGQQGPAPSQATSRRDVGATASRDAGRKKRSRKILKEALRGVDIFNPHSFYAGDDPSGQVYLSYQTGDAWHPRAWSAHRVGHVLGRDHYDPAKHFHLFSPGDTHKERKDAALREAQAWAQDAFGISEWAQDPFGGWGDASYVSQRTSDLEDQLDRLETEEAASQGEDDVKGTESEQDGGSVPEEEAQAPQAPPTLTREQTTTTTGKKGYKEAMSLGERIPEGRSGPWRVERYTVSEEDARADALRAIISSQRGRFVPPGTYTGLSHESEGLMMSDTPDEMRDHLAIYHEARRRGGRVLVHGLGLGMITQALLSEEGVGHVDVVEIDEDVISLVSPSFQGDVDSGRLTIHHADCFEKSWPTGTRWSCVWHDCWRDLSEGNLEEMKALHRKFGRRCDFQGSWGRSFLQRHYR
jgi:hypothetical protein